MAMASHNWQSGKTLSESARFMFENNIATDVTFTFPNTDVTVKAHRFVLMARSSVFYVMFNSSLDKPGEDIEIADIEPDIFNEFLSYVYSCETILSTETALHLAYCAEKYEVTDLRAACTNFLQSQVDETTVGSVLEYAVLYNDEDLISICQDIIEPLDTLSCLEEHHITKDALELVLGFEKLMVGEVDIFKCCNTWARNECKWNGVQVNGSNRRKMLGQLLKKIPFCSMTHEQFATEVSGKHLLNSQEELQIFRFICGPDKSNPPFPCKTKNVTKENSLPVQFKSRNVTKSPLIYVKLPYMQRAPLLTAPDFRKCYPQSQLEALLKSETNSSFKLSISSSKAFTLLGVVFRQAGDYTIDFENSVRNFGIHKHDLEGYLQTPVQYTARAKMTIESNGGHTLQSGESFTHEEHVKGPAGYMVIDFTTTAYGGQPPFDTLIIEL